MLLVGCISYSASMLHVQKLVFLSATLELAFTLGTQIDGSLLMHMSNFLASNRNILGTQMQLKQLNNNSNISWWLLSVHCA
jgi:hypothetical protein